VIKLIFPNDTYSQFSLSLLDSDDETCAILLANEVESGLDKRLLVTKIIAAPSDAYVKRSNVYAELKQSFLIPVIKEARQTNSSVIFCHSHPGTFESPKFSIIDDDGEKKLSDFLKNRIPQKTHGALVISQGGCSARKLGGNESIEVIAVGRNVKKLTYVNDLSFVSETSFDRQIRAFGKDGQKAIQNLKIAIVGLGGTGSIVSSELAHLGVTNLTFIDPDDVEKTNLNRLVGSTPKDLSKSKVEVAQRTFLSINPKAKITVEKADVTEENIASQLTNYDCIFCCTDSHASRAVLNQIAYQYYVPVIDMGVSISTKNGEVSHITGRVQMLSPGLGCLVCANALNGTMIRRELMSETQKKADPYFESEVGQPEPSVISLNGTVSSLAITMFLGIFTQIPSAARLQFYDGIKGVVRSAIQSQTDNCVVCSKKGILGFGDKQKLPTKAPM